MLNFQTPGGSRQVISCGLQVRIELKHSKTQTLKHFSVPFSGLYSRAALCASRDVGYYIKNLGGRGALFAARKRLGRKAASNGSWRSLSFVRFLRSRFETIIFYSACLPSATITGCVRYASYACKKRTPHSLHFRSALAFARRVRVPMGCEPPQGAVTLSPPFPVALQAAKSLPAPCHITLVGRGVAPSRSPRVRYVILIIIANIRNEVGFRSKDVLRRKKRMDIRRNAVPKSQTDIAMLIRRNGECLL